MCVYKYEYVGELVADVVSFKSISAVYLVRKYNPLLTLVSLHYKHCISFFGDVADNCFQGQRPAELEILSILQTVNCIKQLKQTKKN